MATAFAIAALCVPTLLGLEETQTPSQASAPEKSALPSGFLEGLSGFESFHHPIGNPIYFESPFIDSGVRFLYLHHKFAGDSVLAGGDLDVVAAQARLALTDRLAFIATKDGRSYLNADLLAKDEGWNDLAFGFKYAMIVNPEDQFLLTGGVRYQAQNGERDVLQGGAQELSPFVSAAKGWESWNFLGNLTYRTPFDAGDGNNIFQWSLHADYEVTECFAPVLEIHGLHYLNNGNRTGLSIGGLDYSNLGSTNVSGGKVVWMGLGGSYKFTPKISLSATHEFALTDPSHDIMDQRLTVSFQMNW